MRVKYFTGTEYEVLKILEDGKFLVVNPLTKEFKLIGHVHCKLVGDINDSDKEQY